MLKDDPEIIRKYEQYHANQWPEVREGTLGCGIERIFIYRFGRQLFMFMETRDDFDIQRDMPKYMETAKASEWDALMRSFQETVPGAPRGSTWVEMKEVFALEKPVGSGVDEFFYSKPDVAIKRSGLVYTERVVLITGGAKGIGEGCARVFVDAGANVFVIDRDVAAGNALGSDLNEKGPGKLLFLAGDVKNPEDLQRAVDAAVDQHGRIDCLINNAGYHPPHKPIDEFTQEEFEDVLRGNLLSCFTGCRIALPHLRKTKGSVINLGSLVAEIGQELATIYCATKGGLLSFTKSLAIEEARHGVRINCVQPGNVFSDSMRQLIESPGGRRHYHWITANQHVGRVATTEEVGQLCLFLASDAARYLTGISINLSGGAELGYGAKFPLHCADRR